MATTVTATSFKNLYSAFSSTADATVTAAIGKAERWINEGAFSSQARFDDAVEALTRHWLQWDALLNSASTPAASASSVGSGHVQSMNALQASVTYASLNVFSDDAFALTEGGRAYLSLVDRTFPVRWGNP